MKLSEEEQERITNIRVDVDADKALNDTLKRITDSGYILPEAPEGAITAMPESLSELSFDEVADLMGEYAAWYEFLIHEESMISARIAFYNRQLTIAQAKGYALAEGQVTDKRHLRDADAEVLTLLQKLGNLELSQKTYEGLIKGLDKNLFVLSRQLSTMQNVYDKE
jgi:hypothetical protein